ncbi:MAG: T9SS type A sorting domain-containing protein [Candidatus Zixiibacteriota bacterium]|nr:MAG: T9SS type A sorting domain-containing protein [candidate division Zixibacteria bacterium]
MGKIINLALLFCLLILVSQAMGQANSINYRLTNGGAVGGGGSVASANNKMVWTLGFGPMGVSSAGSNILAGGVVAGMPSGDIFFIDFDHTAFDTIPIQNQLLTVAYGNQTGAVTANFYHRPCGGNTFQEVAMTPGAGDFFNYTLPAALLTARGLDYYIEVTDAGKDIVRRVGTLADPFVFICDMSNATGQRPAALPDAQYRIIGVPIDIIGGRLPLLVFGDDLGDTNSRQWRMGRYDPSEVDSIQTYPMIDHLVYPERGYWMIARGARRYGAEGYSMQPNFVDNDIRYYRSEELALDWNQLANPFAFAVDWTAVRFEDNGVVVAGHPVDVLDDAAYSYNGIDYDVATALTRWEGFFLNIKKTGVRILFPFSEYSVKEAPAKLVAEQESAGNWSVNLALAAGGLSDRLNSLGVRPDAAIGGDRYDFAEPPPAPGGPYLAFALPDEKGLFRTDYRPVFDNGAQWRIVLSPANGRSVKVTDLDPLPDGMQAWLFYGRNSRIQLTEGANIALPDDATGALLIIGTDEYLAEELGTLIPEDFVLHQNYPNPFNPTTIVRFALPEPANVTLDVYNILGQKVISLVDRQLQAGYHSVTWDGRDNSGRSVASGVYFYQMSAGNQTDRKKMLLLK